MTMHSEGEEGGLHMTPSEPPEQVVDLNTKWGQQQHAKRWLRWWFEASAQDVEPESENIAPVVMAWCAHRSDRTSRSYFRPVAEAEHLVDDLERDGMLDGNWHVYIRCTTMRHQVSGGGRGGATDTAQLPGFWVDLDAKDGVTEADVLRFIKAMGLSVTPMVTASGGGWHIWWPFSTPVFGLVPAGLFLRRWRHTVERVAAEVGIKADSICSGDPARVMRLAGTWNVKIERPVAYMCTIVQEPVGALMTEDVDGWLDEVPDPQPYNFKSGPAAGNLPGQQFSAAVPMLAVVERMGGHDWYVDNEGSTHVMRPDKDRGDAGCTIYPDGHASFWSTTWVGPGGKYPHVLNGNSGDTACVYNDSFRLLAHAFFGPEDTGYPRAREHVQSLGYGADWSPERYLDLQTLKARLGVPTPMVLPPTLVPEVVVPPVYDQVQLSPPAEAVWANGYLDSGDMLEALGMTSLGKQGSAVAYAWMAADRSGGTVAWAYPSGEVTFQATVANVMPAAMGGQIYRWRDLLALFCDTDNFIGADDQDNARGIWARLVDPTTEGLDDEGLFSRLRRVVRDVPGVGRSEETNRWKFTTALEVSRTPRSSPRFLARTSSIQTREETDEPT